MKAQRALIASQDPFLMSEQGLDLSVPCLVHSSWLDSSNPCTIPSIQSIMFLHTQFWDQDEEIKKRKDRVGHVDLGNKTGILERGRLICWHTWPGDPSPKFVLKHHFLIILYLYCQNRYKEPYWNRHPSVHSFIKILPLHFNVLLSS
jgi:hypothetical protein